VPTQFSTDVIELLRPAAVVRSMGPMTIPMPNGTVKVPKVTTGATASYMGENTNVAKSEEQFGQITLTWKKLGVLVPISNDLIRYSSPSADAVVRDDVVRAMAQREDQAFLRDDGTERHAEGPEVWINDGERLQREPDGQPRQRHDRPRQGDPEPDGGEHPDDRRSSRVPESVGGARAAAGSSRRASTAT
jgi:hypothetical protein